MIRTVWFNEYDKSHMTYDEEMGKTCHRNIRRYKEWTEYSRNQGGGGRILAYYI